MVCASSAEVERAMLVGLSERLLATRKQILRNTTEEYEAEISHTPVCAKARDRLFALKTLHKNAVTSQRRIHAVYVQQLHDAESGEFDLLCIWHDSFSEC